MLYGIMRVGTVTFKVSETRGGHRKWILNCNLGEARLVMLLAEVKPLLPTYASFSLALKEVESCLWAIVNTRTGRLRMY